MEKTKPQNVKHKEGEKKNFKSYLWIQKHANIS